MKILSINSATNIFSICISDNDTILYRKKENLKFQLAERIMDVLDESLKKSKLELDDLDGINFCFGPGSFTGLRISAATIKGLIFNKNINLFGYTIFDELISQGIHNNINGKILVLVDSVRDEFFAGVYNVTGNNFYLINNYFLINLTNIEKQIINCDKVIYLKGNLEQFNEEFDLKIIKVEADCFYSLSFLLKNNLEYKIKDKMNFEPFYLKSFIPKISKVSK